MTPAPDLDQLERYSRAVLLPDVGMSGQARLAGSRVVVVGAGGLGSPALLYLAAAGVGTIGVVDDDDVQTSDLSRQVAHADRAVGRPKTDSAAESIARLNPHVTVVRHHVRLTADNAQALLSGYEVVVDASDSFATRYAVSDACVGLGAPHVWACVLGFDAQVSVWWAGHGPCYRCVFRRAPSPDAVPSCAQAGVLGPVCAVVGSVQATEAVKLLLGIGEPLVGRLLLHDSLRQTWDTLPVRADQQCPSCGGSRTTQPAEAPTGRCVEPVGHIPPAELTAFLAARPTALLVDVREPAEGEQLSIPGSCVLPLRNFLTGTAFTRPELLDRDRPLVFYCASGPRAEQAARLAVRAGHQMVTTLAGGVHAWAVAARLDNTATSE